MNIAQPYTTDATLGGNTVARNAMRLRLWTDDIFAHRWLCHSGQECEDGCNARANPNRLALYDSEIEPV